MPASQCRPGSSDTCAPGIGRGVSLSGTCSPKSLCSTTLARLALPTPTCRVCTHVAIGVPYVRSNILRQSKLCRAGGSRTRRGTGPRLHEEPSAYTSTRRFVNLEFTRYRSPSPRRLPGRLSTSPQRVMELIAASISRPGLASPAMLGAIEEKQEKRRSIRLCLCSSDAAYGIFWAHPPSSSRMDEGKAVDNGIGEGDLRAASLGIVQYNTCTETIAFPW